MYSSSERPRPEIDLRIKNIQGYSDLVLDILPFSTLGSEQFGLKRRWRARLRLALKDGRVARKLVQDVDEFIEGINDPESGDQQRFVVRAYYRLDDPGGQTKSIFSVANGMNIPIDQAQLYTDQALGSLRQLILKT